jgi:hypothetical protein
MTDEAKALLQTYSAITDDDITASIEAATNQLATTKHKIYLETKRYRTRMKSLNVAATDWQTQIDTLVLIQDLRSKQ